MLLGRGLIKLHVSEHAKFGRMFAYPRGAACIGYALIDCECDGTVLLHTAINKIVQAYS